MRNTRSTAGLAIALVILAASVFAWTKQQSIEDWWKLRNYTPLASVKTLASEDSMTSKSKHILYVNHPQLVSNISTFRKDCPQDEQTIVLGCYHASQDGIYVYDVQDSRLDGIQQVTLAHEMLHAAYGRLSTKDKKYVDGLLNDYYTHDVKDQRIIDTINAYKQSEPNDVVDEMHSVFGSEIPNLPNALEQYYKQYFSNRSVVTAFASSYQAEFTGRISQIGVYDQQLSNLKQQINGEEQSLNTQLSQINTDRSRLDSLQSSGQYMAYNASVDDFNYEVSTYNNGVAKLQRDISSYNSLVDSRNSIANDLRSLDSSIDTRLTAQTAQ